MRRTHIAVAFAILSVTLPAAAQEQTAPETPPEPFRVSLVSHSTLEGHTLRVRCLKYSETGVLASGGKDRVICLWSTEGELREKVQLAPEGCL